MAVSAASSRPAGALPNARPKKAAVALPTPPRALDPGFFPVIEKTLANGLSVRLLRDPGVPTVTYYTFFKVGSRNERPGITGISHLFEHMMFNGSAKFGPKEFDRQLESRGGYSNAYTSNDMTAYYEDFDRDALPLVIDLESDRMRALRINDESLASEREVVKEERRFRVDNDIGGMMDEQLDALSYLAHPYHWPVIGWMGDLDRISRPDCEAYFKTYYAPNNAVLFVVGDFDVDATMAAIEKAYGDIPAGPPVPEVPNYEPEQKGERRGFVRHPAQAPALAIAYKAVPITDPLAPALDVLQAILSIGEGARLTRSLVRKQEVATAVGAYFEWRIDLGLYKFVMELPPGGSPTKALAALDKELDALAKKPVDADELARAKNILRGQFLRSLGTHNGKAHALGEHEVYFGTWRKFFDTLAAYDAVSAELVQKAAAHVLQPHRRTVIELVPLADEGAE